MNREALKAELSARNLSVDDLANRIGVNRTTIYRMINGDTVCSVGTAAKIINELKLDPHTAMHIFFEEKVAEMEHAAEEGQE